jgi:hypothetical protein
VSTMLLLKHDPIWSDVTSDILKPGELLKEANHTSVTGFIEFDFQDFRDFILLDEGKILHCVRTRGNKAFSVTRPDILNDLKKTTATVGFFRLKKEILHMTYTIITGEPLFKNMDSKYMDIKQLLLRLEKNAFTGVVTIQSGKGDCFMRLENGSPMNCICERKNQIIGGSECLDSLLNESGGDILVSAYKESETYYDVVTKLKEAAAQVLGGQVEKVETMLEESGTTHEELLKTIEEIEKITYLFIDKNKADLLAEKLRKTVEVIP